MAMRRSLNPNRIERMVQMSEIGLILENYDDIFSDFDPRPYKERALSVDFLNEVKRAIKERQEGIELKLLIPTKKRNHHDEELIKERLKAHFKRHHELLEKERGGIIGKGMIFTIIGIGLMVLATYLLFTYEERSFLLAFLNVLLEPAGWFLFWEGLDYAITQAREQRPELDFYKKMHKASIHFMNY